MSQLNQNSAALEELKTKAASLPAAITIDSTLTQEGQAADAKAVGDALDVPYFDITEFNAIDFATIDATVIGIAESEASALREAAAKGKIKLRILFDGKYYTIYPVIHETDLNHSFICTIGQNIVVLSVENNESLLSVMPWRTAGLSKTGTFNRKAVALGTAQDPSTSLLRNSKIVATDTTPTNNGEICWTYE